MANKSREKVRKAHPGSESDRKTYGFLKNDRLFWLIKTILVGHFL